MLIYFRVADLGPDDIPLIKRLKSIGFEVLQSQGADLEDVREGFHWPFYTVGHLHFHVIR